ncbi:MAG: pantoate--beta-alanine ligase [Legionellaceae bacterium]|nr:pantoate--beta-alanine ligase [Legionellaceae bacterium]
MQIYYNIEEWQLMRQNMPSHLSIGFVPTMGNLHVGHASLLAASRRENDVTVSSVFVNRAQFNRPDDFNKYPRTMDADLLQLEQNGVDYCLIPNEQDIYHDDYRYQIQETTRSKLLEGEFRPGHFTGVLTIVMKLFNLVKPHRSYFGEKDYQQYQLIRDMAASFFMGIDVKACPTIRESSGLAYSSRNSRLSAEERQLADKFAFAFHQLPSCGEIKNKLTELGIGVEYIEDFNNRRYAAVNIGDIRLIDNFSIGGE